MSDPTDTLRERLLAAKAAIRVLDCGAHYCRYCPAGTHNNWQHGASCPYEESQREYSDGRHAIDDALAELDALRARLHATEQERDEANAIKADIQATNKRLNRRAQLAEAAVNTKVEDFEKRSKRALRGYYYEMGKIVGEAERTALTARLAQLEQERDEWQTACRAREQAMRECLVSWRDRIAKREAALAHNRRTSNGIVEPVDRISAETCAYELASLLGADALHAARTTPQGE